MATEVRREKEEERRKKETENKKLNVIIITGDGSHTILVPELNEHYHSVHGAIQESTFIFINSGFEVCKADPVNIFEVGFGTGLNTLLTAVKCQNSSRIVNYTTIEKYPLDMKIINSLNYKLYSGEYGSEVFNSIHSSPWNDSVNIFQNFNLKKIKGDLITDTISGSYDLIYFDAFGPDKQPEMWTLRMFERIAAITNKEGILVTYSAKGEVKRNLRACGFEVTLLPGPPGKREIIRAIKL